MPVPKGKTPISYLQELCNKKGLTPQYDVVSTEGTTVHQPEFAIRVTVNTLIETGKGSSKKKAKHAAALLMLKSLFGEHECDAMEDGESEKSEEVERENPIGELQEFTQKHHLKPPEFIFDEIKTDGPSDSEFNCVCKLGKYTKEGVGKSKKAAKRDSALNMLAYIETLNSSQSEVVADDDDEEDDLPMVFEVKTKVSTEKQNNKNSTFPSVISQEEIKDFCTENLGLKLESICDTSSGVIDACEVLQNCAASHNLEIKYTDIEKPSKSGRQQCLIHINTNPVTVLFGSGSTMKDAHSQAAFASLQCLKIMKKL